MRKGLGRRIGLLSGEFFEFYIRSLDHFREGIGEKIRVLAVGEPEAHFV